ncbi:hypothetical protein ACFZDJ_52430 [Streptomyces sp. NPDC007896]|uniref:hypothetical protein n=1 Tax=Streptomyces sp. NPDC007896 TaxID=3364784 RepID=UPI0036EA4F14
MEIPLVVDRRGLPISLGTSAANTHDNQALPALVQGIPPIRSRDADARSSCTRTRDTTTSTCDDGYARGASSLALLAAASRSPRTWGHHRWGVERTIAWLTGCRRPHRLYAPKRDHFPAFTVIAATLICYRRLPKWRSLLAPQGESIRPGHRQDSVGQPPRGRERPARGGVPMDRMRTTLAQAGTIARFRTPWPQCKHMLRLGHLSACLAWNSRSAHSSLSGGSCDY